MAPSDQLSDRLHPAVQVLTELGAHETIIAEALAARPDLTARQVQDTWAWHQWRRERSGGRLGEGVFFHAIRRGQLHAAPQSEGAGGVIDVDAYTSGAYGDLFRRGGDVSDLEGWTAPERESTNAVIDVDAYTSGAYGDLFRRGGDVSDLQGWAAPLPQPHTPAQPLGGR